MKIMILIIRIFLLPCNGDLSTPLPNFPKSSCVLLVCIVVDHLHISRDADDDDYDAAADATAADDDDDVVVADDDQREPELLDVLISESIEGGVQL